MMGKEYPCIHYDSGMCKKFSDEHFRSWCVEAPCPEQQITNADHIRSMSDEELGNLLRNFALNPPQGSFLNWLKQPYKENTDGDK